MRVTVGDIAKVLETLAPRELAEEWDNPGLLAGSAGREVQRILLALDLRPHVIDEAASLGAELIVTHHPILFRGRKNLVEDDAEGALLCKLVRSECALIAVHTNFDSAERGVNDALAEKLGLREIQSLESGMRLGSVNPTQFRELRATVGQRLGDVVRAYGDPAREIRRVAVLGGAGGGYWRIARKAGADAYVTGEIAYHLGLEAMDEGLCVMEAGHAATERPAIGLLKDGLQNALDALQWNVTVIESSQEPFVGA